VTPYLILAFLAGAWLEHWRVAFLVRRQSRALRARVAEMNVLIGEGGDGA
jgi:hypothetical protein